MKKFLTLITLVLLTFVKVYADDLPIDADPIKIELVNEEETIRPGRPFWVAVKVEMEKGWHAYWKNPGDTGAATTIEWELPSGFTAGSTEWPYPQRFDLNSIIGFGYEGFFWLLTPITPPKNLPVDQPVEIAANVNWLVCSDSNCLPGETKAKLSLPVSSENPKPRADQSASFADSRAKMPKKQWRVEAEKKENLIVLKLRAPNLNKEYHKADFFPETKNLIDNQAEPIWSKEESQPQNYRISFKERENGGKQIESLKGVLVLHSKEAQKPEVVEINVPIERLADQTVAMANETTAESLPLENPKDASLSSSDHSFEGGVGLALVLAFAGGLILNLMPCVLPVVSFKILSFVKLAGQSRSAVFKHGLAFSFGVIISFWALAGVLLILQAYGRSVGWGFQLQEPIFVALLAALLFIFGLSLFGVFELGASLTSLAGSSSSRSTGLTGSFFSGVLATAVATPCTGPFLGTAIGFAVTLPPVSSLMIFTSLALGMSLPYLLLAAFPQLLRFLPKPGNWMVTFKEMMGFLMVATAIWLIWVFGAQTNNLGVAFLLAGLFFMGIGCWILGKWGTPVRSLLTRRIAYFWVAAAFCLGGFTIFTSTEPWVEAYGGASQAVEEGSWEPFSEERIAELQKKGIPVFVDFTAKWCLICQANHYVLTKNDVETKFKQLGVVKMKADWTKNDPTITKVLRQFGRSGVPLYLLYGSNPGEGPAILPQVLTSNIVIDYLDEVNAKMAKS